MDIDSIPLGANFVKVLGDEVVKCDLLLAIEVAPLSWTPDFLSFRSPQWQRSTALMRRSSAGR
jgi:hypothetical protein